MTPASLLTITDAPRTLGVAALVTLVFAVAARSTGAVSLSGTLAGALVSFALYAAMGGGAFAVLVAVFVLSWIATRVGDARKQARGVAEDPGGRDAGQVLANLGVAGLCAAGFAVLSHPVLVLAACAALAEAAADTVSSEYGQAAPGEPVLITTGERVPAGTDGGVSLGGSIAGLLAALAIALVALAAGLAPLRWVPVMVGSGMLGTLADSLLGAWLERRGRLGNNAVNFISTLVAAVAAALARLLT